MYVAIGILTHNDGIRHYGIEGQTLETAKGFLVLQACALQLLHKTKVAETTLDPSTIEDLAAIFSFGEIRKRIL
jgi:hypothetical protein